MGKYNGYNPSKPNNDILETVISMVTNIQNYCKEMDSNISVKLKKKHKDVFERNIRYLNEQFNMYHARDWYNFIQTYRNDELDEDY